MFNEIRKKLSLITLISMLVIGTLTYFAIGEIKPEENFGLVDSISATVTINDTAKSMTDSNIVITDTIKKESDTTYTYIQSGVASWYGPGFHGRKTASGEIFNTHDLTAAHKKLKFGTIIKVVNKSNGKSVIVRINDRGPYVGGRIIDLSNVAKNKIDMGGLAKVDLYRVDIKKNN